MLSRDIEELARQALGFRRHLEKIKRQHRSVDFEWYRYDPFQVFPILSAMLREDRRDLVALAGPAPVLDVGCGDGALSFFFESIGCEVMAIDNWSPNINETRGFRWLHNALNSNVEFQMADADVDLGLAGRTFGLALCLGVLYHLKNPFGFLEALAHHVRYCILSTRIAQVTRKGTSIVDEPVAYLLDACEANNDASNYWVFSETGLRRILYRTGWELCDHARSGFNKGSNPSDQDRDERFFCMIRSKLPGPWLDVDLDGGWHPMEKGSWRWTERSFAVRLRSPSRPNALLNLRFQLPEAILEFTGPIQLHATVDSINLPACTYREPGKHLYQQALPAGVGSTGSVRVRFELDKAWGPTSEDHRQLGVQVVFWDYDSSLPRALSPIVIT